MDLDDLFSMFIIEKKTQGLSERTLFDYTYTYNHFKDFAKERTVDRRLVVEWINYLMSNHNPPSVNRRITDIRVFLYWCMNEGYLEHFRIKKVKYQEDRIKFFTDEELNKLMVPPKKDCTFGEYRTWVIMCFILACGCRMSTLINIKMEDVDFDNNVISYRHLKNKKFATVPMVDSLKSILIKYRNTWRIESEYLFCNITGGQLTTSSIETSFSRYCRNRKVTRHGPHALRHNFSRQFIKNGGNPFTLQQMLTHSDVTMTRKYVRLFSDDIKDEVNRFNALDTLNCLKKNNTRIKRYETEKY